MNISIFFNEKKKNNQEIFKKLKIVLKNAVITQEYANSDFVIAVGGDGTIIEHTKKSAEYFKPVIGINNGKVGFLANLKLSEIYKLEKIFLDDYKIKDSIMIEAEISKNENFIALNDFVLLRHPASGVIEFKINDNPSFRADGLIIATPTGSTAYSYSAGGPVLDQELNCVAITPICPINSDVRTMILGLEKETKIKYNLNTEKDIVEALFSVDGHAKINFNTSGIMTVRKSTKTAKFVKF